MWPFAQVLTVDQTDPDADYSTIQAAIDAASPGAVILVGPGSYLEQITINKNLRIVGHDPGENLYTDRPGRTEINSYAVAQDFVLLTATGSANGSCILENISFQLAHGNSQIVGLSACAIECNGLNVELVNSYVRVQDVSMPPVQTTKLDAIRTTGLGGNVVLKNVLTRIDTINSSKASYIYHTKGSVSVYDSNIGGVDDGGLFAPIVITGSAGNIPGKVTLNNVKFYDINFFTGSGVVFEGSYNTPTNFDSRDIDSDSPYSNSSDGLLRTNGTNSLYKLSLRDVEGNVGNPQDGNIWYDSLSSKFKAKEAGAIKDVFGAAGGSGGALSAESNTPDSTSSSSDVLMDGMTITPGAGNYVLHFSTTAENSVKNGSITVSAYVGGTRVDNSVRNFGSSKEVVSFSSYLSGILAGQAVEVRWQTSGNSTGTVYNRSLILAKV